ncbi:hypothetical protein REPUB_Repub07fG0000200 [Reevesia pubescens]
MRNFQDHIPFRSTGGIGDKTHHFTLLDGEMIIDTVPNSQKQDRRYLIYDMMAFNCTSVIEPEYLSPTGSRYLPLAMECFEPFFGLQKSIKLSNLGEISLSSEFGIVAYVVYVGEVYTAAHQKKQWVFVTDDSVSDLLSEGLADSLLATSFCPPCLDENSFALINSNLVGSMVEFDDEGKVNGVTS